MHFKYLITLLAIFLSTGASTTGFVPIATNAEFRQEVMDAVLALAKRQDASQDLRELDALDKKWANHYQSTHWDIRVRPYYQGQALAPGHAEGSSLAGVLAKATAETIMQIPAEARTNLDGVRFKVSFDYYPNKRYAFIQFGNKALELTGGRVAVRHYGRAEVQAQVIESADYIKRVMNPDIYGFYKFYNAQKNRREEKLRTIYSASSLFTLMQVNALFPYLGFEPYFRRIGDFILKNQVLFGSNAGAFAYSFDPKTMAPSKRYVVGTASKTIFTLLLLHAQYPQDPRYLNAARRAGDWLLTRVDAEGLVSPVSVCESNPCVENSRPSLLYSGQVLSALSRLYAVTKDSRYSAAARKIADHFLARLQKEGLILGDGYRPANSISSSWVMMSLLDFAKISQETPYIKQAEAIGQAILERQITNPADVFNQGRYLDAMTTSGNGWINEVFGVYYDFCKAKHRPHCANYRNAMLKTTRWLLQNAYTPQNSYNVPDPLAAQGGFILSFTRPVVRTDAVCHGVNSLISMLRIQGYAKSPWFNIPATPLKELLPQLRAGYPYLSDE